VIDDFLARWTFARGMTTEFLEFASDECLDFRPTEKFMTIREQASHLVEVQAMYQLGFAGEEIDFARKPEFTPARDDAASLVKALAEQDAVLHAHLEQLRADPDRFSIHWYGTDLGISGFGAVFIQHEALHHGQWAAHTALGGFPTPTGWILNWGLYA
jgi:uncharacterized damage-inducible protein DinB